MPARGLPLLLVLALAGPAAAQDAVRASPDVTVALGSPPVVADDHAAVEENTPGRYLFEDLGPLPDRAEVNAIALDRGDRLFALDSVTDLGGGVVAWPSDVVRYDGAAYTIEFDGRAAGLPDGVTLDAIAVDRGDLLLSFDTAVDLPGGLAATRRDVVSHRHGAFTLALDGAAVGIGPALDIDAVHLLGSRFLLSFDTGGEIGGVVFEDEDLLQYTGILWSLYHDGSAVDDAWEGADLDAAYVPEPGLGAGLATGAAALALLRRRRAARR